MSGHTAPLDGIVVVALAGLGPVPFACGILSDLGATVIRVERPAGRGAAPSLERLGVRDCVIIEADLKCREGAEAIGSILDHADVVIEGFRPGVAERLGMGPSDLHERNPGVVYARITGWGQDGPYAQMAGHDINYLAASGALGAIGDERPVPPLNLLADYAGGALFAVIGILAALAGRSSGYAGGVVDAAMVDGVGGLLGPIQELRALGLWVDSPASNLLDGRAPFYRTYRTADDRFVAVGALEPAFYNAFVEGLDLELAALPMRDDPANWDALAEVFERAIASRTRSEWEAVFAGTDACVTPVLTLAEAVDDPHAVARGTYEAAGGAMVPVAAPRMQGVGPRSRAHRSVSDTLVALGLTPEVAADLEDSGSSYWV